MRVVFFAAMLCVCASVAQGAMYAIVDSSGNVVNITDGKPPTLAANHSAVAYGDDAPAYIGGTYANGVFAKPPQAPQAPVSLAGSPLKLLFDTLVAKGVMQASDVPAAFK